MKPLLLFASLSILTACAPGSSVLKPGSPAATVDFQYSQSSGLGIQNAGRYPAGTVFVWNKRENTLSQWTNISLPLLAQSVASDGESSNVSGFELNANVPGLDLELEALIGRSAKFEATNVVRKEYEKGPGALRDYVAGLKPEDQADLGEILGASDPDIRIVVVTTVIEVGTSKFLLGGVDATGGKSVGKLTLKTSNAKLAEFDVKLSSDLACKASNGASDTGAPCFFDVSVYKVRTSGTGVRFGQDFGARDGLLAAFRKGLKGG